MRTLHAVTRQILESQAPLAVQEFAARGMLPLPRIDFLDLWVWLSVHGSTQEIRQQAQQSLETLSETDLRELLTRSEPLPETFEYLSRKYVKVTSIASVLARHPAVPDSALAVLAEQAGPDVLEPIVVNQTRLMQSPQLLDALRRNPHLTSSQRRRLMEFEEEYLQKGVRYELKKTAEKETIAIPSGSPPVLEAPPPKSPSKEVSAPEIPSEVIALEQKTQNDPHQLYFQLKQMTVPQKIMMALFGSRSVRSVLIRDRNRLVLEAIVKSPRLTEAEAEAYAAMRHLQSDILRILAERREFYRNRNFIYRVVSNPKTPAPIALRLMGQLTLMQLRDLSRSRDVPALVRNVARDRVRQMTGAR